MNLTDKLTIDNIPDKYKHLAELVGIPTLIRLANEYGGDVLYIPQLDTLIKSIRDDQIRKEYTGYNAEELARKYDLSVRWVQLICADMPIGGQTSLFDNCD